MKTNENERNERKEEENMKVIIIEPGKKARKGEIGTDLESLQQAVDGYIEAIYPWEDPVCIIANEEGKLNGLKLNRALKDEEGNVYDVIAGTFIIAGLTEDNFGDIPDDLMGKYLKMFESPEQFLGFGNKIIAVKCEDLEELGKTIVEAFTND